MIRITKMYFMRRTIEILQRARIFKPNHCLKVHNVNFKFVVNFGISVSFSSFFWWVGGGGVMYWNKIMIKLQMVMISSPERQSLYSFQLTKYSLFP